MPSLSEEEKTNAFVESLKAKISDMVYGRRNRKEAIDGAVRIEAERRGQEGRLRKSGRNRCEVSPQWKREAGRTGSWK